MSRLPSVVRRLLGIVPGSRPASSPVETLRPVSLPSTYSRFSLALVREPSELPYRGDQVVKGPTAVVPFLHRLLEAEPYECLGAVFLTSRNHPIGHTIPFRGTLTSCRVEPRQFLLVALAVNAGSMVLFHNHPSGEPTPSREDRDFYRRVRDAGDILGVTLQDFIVLGEPPAYRSFRTVYPVLPTRPRRRRRRPKPKYRHPGELSLTWVGTVNMPVWLRMEVEAGASLSDFLVEGAEVTKAAARQEQKVRERARLREVVDRDGAETP